MRRMTRELTILSRKEAWWSVAIRRMTHIIFIDTTGDNADLWRVSRERGSVHFGLIGNCFLLNTGEEFSDPPL